MNSLNSLILPHLPKSLQLLWLDHGRSLFGVGLGVLCVIIFIGIYEIRAEKVARYALLEVVERGVHTGNNRSLETLFTVQTLEGQIAQFATQSPAILRDAGTHICAEERVARSGRRSWEAAPMSFCR